MRQHLKEPTIECAKDEHVRTICNVQVCAWCLGAEGRVPSVCLGPWKSVQLWSQTVEDTFTRSAEGKELRWWGGWQEGNSKSKAAQV